MKSDVQTTDLVPLPPTQVLFLALAPGMRVFVRLLRTNDRLEVLLERSLGARPPYGRPVWLGRSTDGRSVELELRHVEGQPLASTVAETLRGWFK